MSLLTPHLPALKRLEQRVEKQDFIIKETHLKAERVVEKFKELEVLIIKNFGQKIGEELVEKLLKPHQNFINSRISMNQFDDVEQRIKVIEKQVEKFAISHAGAFVH